MSTLLTVLYSIVCPSIAALADARSHKFSDLVRGYTYDNDDTSIYNSLLIVKWSYSYMCYNMIIVCASAYIVWFGIICIFIFVCISKVYIYDFQKQYPG